MDRPHCGAAASLWRRTAALATDLMLLCKNAEFLGHARRQIKRVRSQVVVDLQLYRIASRFLMALPGFETSKA